MNIVNINIQPSQCLAEYSTHLANTNFMNKCILWLYNNLYIYCSKISQLYDYCN